MTNVVKAKAKLDRVLAISRVHFYKPIQIAEILHRHRKKMAIFSLTDSEFYRTNSKNWRDQVSSQLVGRVSTSSAKYQDDVFGESACPPWAIVELGTFNEAKNTEGVVEAYVYKKMLTKLNDVSLAQAYLEKSGTDFVLEDFINLFQRKAGLKRSVDKVFEITVHALFSAIVQLLKVEIAVSYDGSNTEAVKDFSKFIKAVLGIEGKDDEMIFPAKLFRVGVTNAADRGLDMFANFGIAVQIKHLSLSEELAEDIAADITADRIVIVCKDAEEEKITKILSQVGMGERIKGIITLEDLKSWYAILLDEKKYGKEIATVLATNLLRDFREEFPSTDKIAPFLQERGYDKISMPKEWKD